MVTVPTPDENMVTVSTPAENEAVENMVTVPTPDENMVTVSTPAENEAVEKLVTVPAPAEDVAAFEIGIPDQRERAEILKIVLKREKIKSKIDFDCIAILCEGSSGSDLLEPCKKVAYFPIRDLLDEENKGEKSSDLLYSQLILQGIFIDL
uniref:Uncharacterized protein n=1 Tax=Populus alba TaxID=43335 RepID=A0A4U5PTD7_POPAL|nr:hypothetical protein D5086_0000182100 [Populus alba]